MLAPSHWILRWRTLIAPHARILDLACGSGRHMRALIEAGHAVTGVDRDISGIADLAGRPNAEIVAADLEDGSPWPLGERRFGAVLVANYLHRPLFDTLLAALSPGGALLYETFAAGNERYGKPSNPDFLLRDGELLDIARGRLFVVAYEAVELQRPRRAVVQRIAAVKAKG